MASVSAAGLKCSGTKMFQRRHLVLELLIKMHAASVNPKTGDLTLHFRKTISSSDFAIVQFN
jgi:hypothetical protein